MIEQIKRRMDSERSTAAQYCVSFTHEPAQSPLVPANAATQFICTPLRDSRFRRQERRIHSLDDRPIVVTGVAGLGKDLQPTLWKIMKFRREHPAFEDLLLLRREVGVNLN